MPTVLLTGTTGYIGRRLLERLAKDSRWRLRLFVRSARKLQRPPDPAIEVFEGSTFDPGSLRIALAGVDSAYYLIHSLGAKGDFTELDRTSAANFRDACIAAGVRRIIYLGGLGTKETASRHLRSRIETGEILSARPDRIQTLWFRAAVIIGSGSASFEIIRHLVHKIPVLIAPRWVSSRTQPIGVDDVLSFLQRGADLLFKGDLVVDIGSEIMSFESMLLTAAKVMGLRRHLIKVPLFTPKLSSFWLILMTPVPSRIARSLVDGLKSETVVGNDNARRFFPEIVPESYESALRRALDQIELNQVLSRWCDSSAQETCDLEIRDKISEAVFSDRRVRSFSGIPAAAVFRSFASIGGETGWLAFNGLWRVRGIWDKLSGGPGLNRGRRDRVDLRIGDSLDFWKVLDVQPGKRLLLVAQMNAPGRAWLEFAIEGQALIQTAYFLPRGLGGRLYWHALKPAHAFIFRDMTKRIIDRAGTAAASLPA